MLKPNQASEIKRRYDRGRLRAIAEREGLRLSRDGRIQCPARCSDDPRGATVSDTDTGGVWQCKRCGKGGSVIDLVMVARGVELPAALEHLGATPAPAPTPVSQKPPVDGAATWPRLAERDVAGEAYLRGRGLEAAIPLVRFNVGSIGRVGDVAGWLDEKSGRGYRVAVPMRDVHGHVATFQVRNIRPDITPKFSKLSLPGPSRKDVAFGRPDLARTAPRLYITEGMADTLAVEAAGVVVVGAPGEGQLRYIETLLGDVAGREIVLCPQNDPEGCSKPECSVLTDCRHRRQSQKSFEALGSQLAAKGARIATLLPPTEIKDPADWLKAVGLEAFRTALGAVTFAEPVDPPLQLHRGGRSAPGQLPVIQGNDRQLRDIVADAWGAVRLANTGPTLFIQSGRLVRLQTAGELPRIEPLSVTAMFGHLARVADWVRVTKEHQEIDDSPPREVAADMLEYPAEDLPPLDAVVTTPVFDSGARLVESPGYHRGAALWYHPRDGFSMPPVPERPTEHEAVTALNLLTDDLLGDFPFVRESDRAHALAALLLPFVRRFIPGPTPLHLIEAPTPGSGKSLLANAIGIVTTGADIPSITFTPDEDEIRKKITAKLSSAPPILLLDNIKASLDSATLASALTSETWEDRPFGQNTRMVVLPNRTVWLATANNPALSLEIARRCLRIRLDARSDRPWKRTGFKHEKLLEWARANRGELVRAALTVVRFWLTTGRNPGEQTLGSFEAWASTVGGILESVLVPGFLADQEELYEEADAEGAMWREFCSVWWERFGSSRVKPASLLELALDRGLLASVLGDKGPKSQQARFGKALSSLRDRQFAQWRIAKSFDSDSKANVYSLLEVEQ